MNIIDEEEKEKILLEFNNTDADYPREKTLQEIFEEKVLSSPEKTAVLFEDKKLTYRELNEKANSLAGILRKNGVKPDFIVGIMVEKSIEMVVGILAILKAGGAYLPIDPAYPEDRIDYILKNSGTNILLTQDKFRNMVEFDGKILDLYDEQLYKEGVDNLENKNNPNNLAYIIYTSGTTGKPKGVMVEHRNVLNTLFYLENKYPVKDEDVYLLKTKYTFDVSITELFGWFIGHGSLAILGENDEKDIMCIISAINKYKVTHINFVPAMLNIFNQIEDSDVEKLKSLKYVMAAGEELKVNVVDEFYKKFNNVRLENLYGPTEAAIYASGYTIDKNLNRSNVPIGVPIQNTKLYVVDNNCRILPIGIPGELIIAGLGVSRGYLNNEELTKEKFIENPYKPGEMMYKTGDLARWLPDGNIEYLGRIDSQVKIRGFRIELGEVENCLIKIEGIKQAIVVAKGEKDKYLCCYYVSNRAYSIDEIRRQLIKLLPEYMIPSYFVKIDKIPLTLNGKIDRRSLPEPDMNINTGEKYEAPRNKREEKLIEIWESILGVRNIGINSDFFNLGGNSLKLTTLVSRINEELNTEVPLKKVFNRPTVKNISEYISLLSEKEYGSIEKAEDKEYYGVSSAEKRMYMVQQYDKSSITYNIYGALEVFGDLNINKVERSFQKLIERHEMLRTSFFVKDGVILQKIHDSKEIYFRVEQIQIENESQIQEKINNFIRPFNLNKAPLLRAAVLSIEKDRYIMLFDIHHIISDGVSMYILMKEFSQLYTGIKLKNMKIQYKDYAEWQLKQKCGDKLKKQEEYWIKEFSGDIPLLNMRTDYPRPKIKDFNGNSIKYVLDKKTTMNLRKVARENSCTMYMVLLANFNILLSKYTGQEDIVVGTPIAGRNHGDLENIIGMFVNTLAIRSTVDSSLTFEEYLRNLREKTLNAYENQDYQFEDLVEKIEADRDISRNPLFDVLFALENMEEGKIEIDDLTFKSYDISSNTEKFDMSMIVTEREDEIHINMSYATSLYKHETIEQLLKYFNSVVNLTSNNSTIVIDDINLITNEERDSYIKNVTNNKFNEDEFKLEF